MRLSGKTLILSERNLLSLLTKLYTSGSVATLAGGTGCPMSVAAELDDVHYGQRSHPPGPMHPVTERLLAAVHKVTAGADLDSPPPEPMLALFARSNHPVGWGYPPLEPRPDSFGRAHGYVVLGVRCDDQREVDAVVEQIVRHGWRHPTRGEGDTWFSGGPGDFDHLGVIYGQPNHDGHVYGRGDNRLYLIVEAGDVLPAT